jgi:hypothetical protein
MAKFLSEFSYSHYNTGKVMRKIAQLEDGAIPRDGEFKIRERAQKLVNEWQTIVSSAGAGKKEAADIVNGDGERQAPPHVANGDANKETKMDVDATDSTAAAAAALVAEPTTGDVEMRAEPSAVEGS